MLEFVIKLFVETLILGSKLELDSLFDSSIAMETSMIVTGSHETLKSDCKFAIGSKLKFNIAFDSYDKNV